ncbi:IBR domain [Trinorchestia longiramus]|nr:IBR domain [Trinorchestia longiramus]
MDLEAQSDELVVLSSIFEDCFHEAAEEQSRGGELVISLDLPGTITLTSGSVEKCSNSTPVQVQHLPPVYLHFCYPPDYPSSAPPSFSLSCKWITKAQLSVLCRELDRLWEEKKGEVVIYNWSQFIREETAGVLGLGQTLDVDSISPKKCTLRRQSSSQSQNAASSSSQDCPRNLSARQNVNQTADTSNKAGVDHNLHTSGSYQNSNCDNNVNEEIKFVYGNNTSFNVSDISKTVYIDNVSSAAQLTPVEENGAVSSMPSGSKEGGSSSVLWDDRAVQDVAPKTNLLMLLRDYDQDTHYKEFCLKSFACKVCFMEKIGKICVEFWPCGHVYCKDCMKSYFEVQIKEGNVKALLCPTEKCSSEANPKQVEELVSRELYERWDTLLLSSTLSELGDTQPCPRQHCQYPVTLNEGQGHCPNCFFVFCALCRFGTHGREPCRLNNKDTKQVLEKYTKGDAATRAHMESRFGKKYLMKLHQEMLSMDYMSSNAKKCPKCRANVEKMDGCNKMVCQWCRVNFCWLCMKILDAARPYEHFNGSSSECFNRLFEGVDEPELDDVDEDEWDDYDPDDLFLIPPELEQEILDLRIL